MEAMQSKYLGTVEVCEENDGRCAFIEGNKKYTCRICKKRMYKYWLGYEFKYCNECKECGDMESEEYLLKRLRLIHKKRKIEKSIENQKNKKAKLRRKVGSDRCKTCLAGCDCDNDRHVYECSCQL